MPINMIIIEGARGAGKTSVARLLRNKIPEATLINPTGFHSDGKEGLHKVVSYYAQWMEFFQTLNGQDATYTFILDRFFMSELVYSQLCKSYSFEDDFSRFLDQMRQVVLHLTYVHLSLPVDEELEKRLNRQKVTFYSLDENVKESRAQEKLYMQIFYDMQYFAESLCLRYETDQPAELIAEDIINQISQTQ